MIKNYNVKKVLYVLRRWKTISAITIIITIVALLANIYYVKPVYEASSEIFIGTQEQTTDSTNSQYNVTLYENLMGTYEQLYKSYEVVYAAVTEANLSESAWDIVNNLTISSSKNTQLMTISLKGYEPDQEVAILQAVNQAFLDQSKKILPDVKMTITENPSAANIVPTDSNKKLNIFIGFIIGLSIGIGVAFLLEYFNNKFRDSEEVENELNIPVIGTIMKENE